MAASLLGKSPPKMSDLRPQGTRENLDKDRQH